MKRRWADHPLCTAEVAHECVLGPLGLCDGTIKVGEEYYDAGESGLVHRSCTSDVTERRTDDALATIGVLLAAGRARRRQS